MSEKVSGGKMTCAQCNSMDTITKCDKCNLHTCRKCSRVVSLPKGEISIKHEKCIPKRGKKNDE